MLNILKNSVNTFILKQPIRHQRFSLCSLRSELSRMRIKNPAICKGFSEKVKLKERIELVDYDKMEIEKEQWGELLANSVEKENISRFYDQINYLKQKKIPLTIQEINKILQIVHNKYPKAVDLLHDWMDDNNLQMDSITFHFLIMSAIKFRGYNTAFNLFFRAHLFNVPQNLSVIIALCKEFTQIKNKSEKSKYKNFIQIHIRKYYSVEVSKLLSSLNIEFERDEEINEESGKFEEILRKNKKLKKNFEERKNPSEKSERSTPNLSRKRTNSLKTNNKENQGDKESSGKNINESQNNLNEQEKEKISNLNNNSNEQSDAVITTVSLKPEEIDNNKSDPANQESSENKKVKKKSKDKKSRKNYDNTLDNIFGNGGIIVIAQSLHNPDESDSSDSD